MTIIDIDQWRAAGEAFAEGSATFVAIWAERDGDEGFVHLAGRPSDMPQVEVFRLATRDLHFPSIGRVHAPAILMERAIQDLHGMIADGLPDLRPWLDHGYWLPTPATRPYAFKPVTGTGIHQIPVGPIHAGTIEPGHFRISVNGDTVVRLEARLGYAHKGTMALMRGVSLEHAARLAGRISGDSTVAYAFAFARAVEFALGIDIPPRAAVLRGVMAELERLANHFGDIGAICNDGGFPIMNAHCAVLRERILRLARICFGHRLMMDNIRPGGVAADLADGNADTITAELATLMARFEQLVELYDKTASMQDRAVSTGKLVPMVAQRLGCGGYVGRSSMQDFDARRDMAYPPYDTMTMTVPCRDAGDVDARIRIRIEEIRQSVAMIGHWLQNIPRGAVWTMPPDISKPRAASAVVEGFRGDIFAHVRVAGGRVEDVFLRDPSWFLWPALEAAIEGNIVADFPLCNKSFNCAYSGVDL
ncbi:MAG: hydrogenase expression protein HypE [Proteobacteria bacterium]|nr:hydrogenase expression protein HypE [Pseudomonadota bacterium]